jgi:ABC-2 type transport system ATP-binding protein
MIRFDNVAKSFRKVRVLDDINLEIGLAERVALIGSNGAGKTTLIRCLLGEYTFDGKVTINGRDPRQERTAVLGNIGFVPQLPPPLKMPVAQLIDFSAALCGTDPAEDPRTGQAPRPRPRPDPGAALRQALRRHEAEAADRHRAGPRGQAADHGRAGRQPRPRSAQDLLRTARRAAGRHTMLISSHRLNEVSALVNRVIEMDMGKVVLDDRVADDVSLSGQFACRIAIKRASRPSPRPCRPGTSATSATAWNGRAKVPGPDRLRFMGMTSRYVA